MRKIVEERKIDMLIHFTQADNLESILRHGIIPISEHKHKGIKAMKNDSYRLDFCENATSISIDFPNYKLFYKFRMKDTSINWVILALEPSILWEKQCIFCPDNAANSNVSLRTIQERMGREAMLQMFAEHPNKPSRSVLGIPDACPTNPQAEVLVNGTIETKYIGGVAFQNKTTLDRFTEVIPSNIPTAIVEGFFDARKDFNYW
ncbi:DarT ssDNA thymidine ADP-ribosyltransferase family protein [Paenibacillus durus]|uniref:DarT domain-containing protein n=1 Tax=Paenibacillus durus ATCC 35681 TaxID=1333534 RepID=A0A0F7CHY4_PAEDU|nr:DarT ssDNA thymidine ADP-ribosyltransferase family protein [Paenibacillus durus]AKG34881.1 hypothetical protein VK70_10150 [Paenibacillus durus ATCC 35681]